METPSLARPNNEYGNIKIQKVIGNLEVLTDALGRLEESSVTEQYKGLYGMLFQESIKKNRFIYANWQINDAPENAADNINAMQFHQETNHDLYGVPNNSIFWGIIREKLRKIEYKHLSLDKKKEYEELLSLLGPIGDGTYKEYQINQEVFLQYEAIVKNKYRNILERFQDPRKMYSVDDVCSAANDLLSTIQDKEGNAWRAMVEPGRSTAAVREEEKKVLFPGNRSKGDYSSAEAKAILVHEIGVHVLRGLPFSNHKISAFYKGFPHYEESEEGIAKATEQATTGIYRPTGLLHYVSIGLADILKKSFRESFEIQVRLEHLTGGVSASQCFDSIQRAYRGTGLLANNKDLVYYNGTNKIWDFITEHIDDPSFIVERFFFTGKTDVTDDIQQKLVIELQKIE